jgi:hypothetical protein
MAEMPTPRAGAGYAGLGIAAGTVDALECRFPQENGALQIVESLTHIPNPV